MQSEQEAAQAIGPALAQALPDLLRLVAAAVENPGGAAQLAAAATGAPLQPVGTPVLAGITPTSLPAPVPTYGTSSSSGFGVRGDGLCGDFQRGLCTRGADCRFLHTGGGLRESRLDSSRLGGRGDGFCGDYQRGYCSRGDDCKYIHSNKSDGICKDFQFGRCVRGSDCKYSHALAAVTGGKGDGVCGDFQKGICTRGSDCKYVHAVKSEGICKDFQWGRCSRGDDCRYTHDRTPLPLIKMERPRERSRSPIRPLLPSGGFRGDGLCGDFQRGHCSRGLDCRFSHGGSVPISGASTGFRGDGMCGDFQRGACSRGAACRYSHGDFPVPIVTGGRGDGICGDYQRGLCTRGADCKYTHAEKSFGICKDFQWGKCSRGNACRYSHNLS